MIRYMNHDGIIQPVIVMSNLIVTGDVRELHKALMDLLETCLQNEKTKNSFKSISLWYLVRLIDETNIEEKGGVCHG